MVQVIEKQRSRAIRPLSHPVAPNVREAVDRFIDPFPGVESLSMARLSIKPEAGITIVVAATRTPPEGFRERLISNIREECGDDVIVRLFAFVNTAEVIPDDSAKPATDTE